MTDFSTAGGEDFRQPFRLPQTRNDEVRAALCCPTCKRSGTIVPERRIDRPLAMDLICRMTPEANSGCGFLGTFEPPGDLWLGQSPQTCVKLLQSFLDGLDSPSLPEDAVSKLGALEQKDREIEKLRSAYALLVKKIHGSYHHEAYDESWKKCPYPTCAEARAYLGIYQEPA